MPVGNEADHVLNGATIVGGAAFKQIGATAASYLQATRNGDLRLNGDLLGSTLYSASGLRRWTAVLGDALNARAPICCVGDSTVAGQGAANVNSFSDATCNLNGWPGQLRSLFSKTYGDPGEGYIFAASQSSRVTVGSGSNFQQYGPLRKSTRMLASSGHSQTLAVPAGCTTVGIIQANTATDVTAQYNLDAAGATNIVALSQADSYVETEITVTSGSTHSIVVTPPASAQSYISGYTLRNGTTGVDVHRIGSTGYVLGDMIGGQTSGVLTQTAANQTKALRACYQWAGSSGLVIIDFGINDQANQAGAGTAAQNNVTISLYTAWMQQIVNQIVSDGWCVLLLGPPRNPNAPSVTGGNESDYYGALRTIAGATDHVSFLDIGATWGSAASSGNSGLGLQFSSSVHPNRKGYGDIARRVYAAITSPTIAAIVEAP